jgi:hypothetical protein
MRNPMKVMTNIKTNERASSLKAMDKASPPVLNHSHRLIATIFPAGGDTRNAIPVTRVIRAEIPTENAPEKAIACLDILLPKLASTRKPNRGIMGIRARRIVIFLSVGVFQVI